MIVVKPIAIGVDNLTATNVDEDETAWDIDTTYAANQQAAYNHRVYESVGDDNVGHQPDTGALADPPTWIDLGPTNRYRMFDDSPSTTTQRAGTIQMTIDPGKVVDSVGLINVSAIDVTVERLSLGGDTVWSETRSLADVDELGDGDSNYLTDVAILDIPPSSLPVRVTINASGGTAICGCMVIGRAATIGDTEFGTTLGIRDYSKKDTDDFGNSIIVKRAYSNTADFAVVLDTSRLGAVRRMLTKLRAAPALYVGTTTAAETILYGFYKSFTLVRSNPIRSTGSIEIESLTYEGADGLFPDATLTTPSITSPAADEVIASNGTITASAFATDPAGADTQAQSDWQIASDDTFTTIVHQSMADTVNLSAYTIPSGALDDGSEYYVRVRYWGAALGAGQWSDGVHFSTDIAGAAVDAPSVTSPASDGDEVDEGATLTSSAFSVTGGSDTHASSDWQIATDAAFTSVVEESLADTTNLTSWPVPALTDGTTYYLRVRHNGATYGASAWSATRSFDYAAIPFELVGLPAYIYGHGTSAASMTLAFHPDGTWSLSRSGYSGSFGTWHTGSFSGGDYQIQFAQVGAADGTGATVTNGASSFVSLSSIRSLSISCPYHAGEGEYNCDWQVTIREIATPTNEVVGSVTVSLFVPS